ncbi:MAG: NAD-dependent DNA ligase LigA, partial [Clostridia bacterium]|nr:NAD-dependent DNA ligase LigA [Clostridia bacterium]
LNVEGFSEMTATVLLEKFNVEKFSDLFKLTREDLLLLDGFKDLKTDKLINSLNKAKEVEFSNFIYALGIENVGKKTAMVLADKFSNLDALKSATVEELNQIEDVGDIMAQGIYSYFHNEENLLEIDELLKLGVNIKHVSSRGEGVFSAEKVVLTGTLLKIKRDEASKLISLNGGEVVSSVSKKTTLVIAGESAGSKLDKANALGIKVIGEDEFFEMLNKNNI